MLCSICPIPGSASGDFIVFPLFSVCPGSVVSPSLSSVRRIVSIFFVDCMRSSKYKLQKVVK